MPVLPDLTNIVLPSIEDLVAIIPFLGFVVLWCGILKLVGKIGPWYQLAQQFHAIGEPMGTTYRFQSLRFGMKAKYNGVITAIVSPRGLYLRPWFMFRIGHPPILIPWQAVTSLKEGQFILPYGRLTIGPPVNVEMTIGSRLLDAIQRSSYWQQRRTRSSNRIE